MQSAETLSPEALSFLATAPDQPPVRTLDNLRQIRTSARQLALARVDTIVESTGVTLQNTRIGGVACLIVRPSGAPAEWSILYGFGGGYVQGSALEDLSIIAPLCEMTKATVIVPEYRLAPEHPWPAAVEDALAVYERMADKPCAIVGESAGGNLALCLMLRARQMGMHLPGAAALLSPWCDLTNSGDGLTRNEGRDPTLTVQSSRFAAAHYHGRNAAENPDISPLFGAFDSAFPPTIITTGTRDLLLYQVRHLAKRLHDSGVRVDLRVWDGLWHVFEWYDDIPEARQSLQQIAAFLSENMNR